MLSQPVNTFCYVYSLSVIQVLQIIRLLPGCIFCTCPTYQLQLQLQLQLTVNGLVIMPICPSVQISSLFLPRDALQCKARYCDFMSSVCLSARLSVTLVDQDHIGWKPWKLIVRTISPTPNFALCSPKAIHLFPREHGEIAGRLEVGWGKVACWSTKAAISLKRVKIEQKILAYKSSPTLF